MKALKTISYLLFSRSKNGEREEQQLLQIAQGKEKHKKGKIKMSDLITKKTYPR